MKKVFFAIILIFCVMTFTCAYASTDQKVFDSIHNLSKPEKSIIRLFHLPDSLQKIEDEAFEGTAVTEVILPETVTTIGERAFADIDNLRSIRIPIGTISIADNVFAGSNRVVITAAPNSYARAWAKKNHVPFSPITVMYAGFGGVNASTNLVTVSKEIIDIESIEKQESIRTWKRLEEIEVYNTIKIIANIVQGRAPPVT